MIIACPQCGFSGKVPDHAALAPHQARCPKCRCRFDIGDPDVQIPEPVGRTDLRHDLARPRLDPSDSSYELDPIVDGFEGVWDVPLGEEFEDDEHVPAPTATSRAVISEVPPPSGKRVPEWMLRPFRISMWRIRLFQVWAILLLVWAAWIVVRTAIALSRMDDAQFLSNDDLLRPILAVVVLVSTSALLCLSVDVSRRLIRLTYAPTSPPPVSAPVAPPSSGTLGAVSRRVNGNGVDFTQRRNGSHG
ncbi:zinc ribbon domain-containing protein [Paludisphaera rhizosphaerae]|uniref:hypothetical protein n=1 Tax=Paludisphaera rhizosphaerae TaxID=2711216 RepID=UPI0013EE0057|nr:hypothetical protein [Paludisphaera rhizosphaerae]